MRAGKFALITPVTTSVEGRCVATMRWIPAARAICASRAMYVSTSREATIIRSASSSMMMTRYGSLRSCSSRATGNSGFAASTSSAVAAVAPMASASESCGSVRSTTRFSRTGLWERRAESPSFSTFLL